MEPEREQIVVITRIELSFGNVFDLVLKGFFATVVAAIGLGGLALIGLAIFTVATGG